MSQFPTVGLGVDLSGIDAGKKAYKELKAEILAVGAAADATAGKVQAAATRTKAASGQAVAGKSEEAKAAEAAAARQVKADADATKAAERNRKYLQGVRIRSLQMEEAARNQARIEEAAAAAAALARAEAAEAARIKMALATAKLVVGAETEMAKAAQATAEVQIKAATTVTAFQKKMWAERQAAAVTATARIGKVVDDANLFAERQFAASAARQTAAAEKLAATRARIIGQVASQTPGASAANQGAVRLAMGSTPEVTQALAAAERELAAAQAAGNAVTSEETALRAALRAQMFGQIEAETGLAVATSEATAARAASAGAALSAAERAEITAAKYIQEGVSLASLQQIYSDSHPIMQAFIAQTAASGVVSEEAAAAAIRLRAAYDPLFAAQQRLAAVTAEANALRAAGALTAAEEADVVMRATRAFTLAQGSVGGLSLKVREMLVIIREMSRGDITRLAGSASILAQAFGLITAALVQNIVIIAAAAAPFAILFFGIEKGEEQVSKLNGALLMTGNYAGLTADKVDQMARRISTSSDTAIGESRKTIESLVETGRYSGATIASLADAAQNYARITGQNADTYVKAFEGMKDHLVQFAVKHEEVYHDLTLAQVQHIDNLVKEGKETEAQEALAADIDAESKKRLAQKEADLQTHYGNLQRWAHEAAVAASSVWDAILGIGRGKTLDEQISEQTGAVMTAQDRLQTAFEKGTANGRTPLTQPQIDSMKATIASITAKLSALQNQKLGQDQKAAADAAEAKKNHDAIQRQFGDGKTRAHARTPVDKTDNVDAAVQARIAELDQQIATAKKEELQAEMLVVGNLQVRADLQMAADDAESDKKVAGYQKKIASINGEIAAIGDVRLDTHKRAQVANLQELQDGYRRLQASQSYTQTMKDLAVNFAWVDRQAEQQVEKSNLGLQAQEDQLSAQAALSKSAYQRTAIELQIQKLKQQEAFALQQAVINKTGDPDQKAIEQQRLANMKAAAAADNKVKEADLRLTNAIDEATHAVDAMKNAFKNHNWGGLYDAFVATIQTIQAAFDPAMGGGMGRGLATTGAAVGGMFGKGTFLGKAGSAIGFGAGLGASATMLGGAMVDAGSMGALGALSGGALGAGMGLAAIAGPIAIIAGVAMLASSLLKKKPSNHGAIAQITGDSYSLGGDKRNDETTQAAINAADGIVKGQQALAAAGVKLNTTVKAIDIGSRDMTHIFLSNGQELRSAVGDSAAAAETALKAMLDGATYTSDTQKKLVDSMLAAGKGFDDIATALQNYTAAQSLISGIDDAIQQILDPNGAALKALQTQQKAQVTAVSDAYNAGYLSADQYATALEKLNTLQGLQTKALKTDQLKAANDNLTQAQQDLNSAYQNALQPLQDVRDQWQGFVDDLKTFGKTLDTGALAENSPEDQYTKTKAAFETARGLAAAGDKTAIANLPQLSTDFLAASKNYYATTESYYRDLDAVKAATLAAANYAQTQVDAAQTQIGLLNDQVAGLLTINTSVLTVAQAIDNLRAAQAAVTAVQTANDNTPAAPAAPLTMTQRAQAYMDAHHDIRDSAASGWLASLPDSQIGDLNSDGKIDAIDRAIWHYQNYGQQTGLQFAKGAAFDGGEVVSSPTKFALGEMGEAGPEAVMPLTRASSGHLAVRATGSAVDAETKALLAEVVKQAKVANVLAKAAAQQTAEGLESVRGEVEDLRKQVRAAA